MSCKHWISSVKESLPTIVAGLLGRNSLEFPLSEYLSIFKDGEIPFCMMLKRLGFFNILQARKSCGRYQDLYVKKLFQKHSNIQEFVVRNCCTGIFYSQHLLSHYSNLLFMDKIILYIILSIHHIH